MSENPDEFMVVCASAWASPGIGSGISYDCDQKRFRSRVEAVKHGLSIRGSDDFNIVIVRDNKLIWFGWMENQILEPRETMLEIAEACGVNLKAKRAYRFKLNPCPRCKNDDNLCTYEYENGSVHVECTACNYLGPGCSSRRQAAKAHNAGASS